MAHLIDTNIAIDLRDRVPGALLWLGSQSSPPLICVVSRVELENGVYSDPALTASRRLGLDDLLSDLTMLDFGLPEAEAYRRIVALVGFSRPRTLDRMIAATALVHGLTLATRNPRDFVDIDGLVIESW